MSTTTTQPLVEPTFSSWKAIRPYRLSVDRYEAMVASGVFGKRDRIELIEGFLVEKMTKKPPHSAICVLTGECLASRIPAGWHVRIEQPVRIPSRSSEPEPDIAIVRGNARDYLSRHPEPADVGLVVEVSDSSLTDDRDTMARIYAGGGVPIYWIINLVDRQVEVHEQPDVEQGRYALTRILKADEEAVVILDGVEHGRIAVPELLP